MISKLTGQIAAVAAALTLAACASIDAPNDQPESEMAGSRPNVLFVLIDDMGYGDFSSIGGGPLQTESLDRMASEGLLIERFYLGAPICSPSRVAFFTGDFPAKHRFVTFIHTRESNRAAGQADWLDPNEPNLARLLQSAGYATGHFGKWHMGGGRDVGDAPHPVAYGFDESFVNFEGLGPRALISDHPGNLSKQSEALGQGPIFWLEKHKLTGTYIARAKAFIDRNRDRPWFVQLWLDDVHSTWQPSDEQLAAVAGLGRSSDETDYFAVLAAMDRQLGALVDWLDANGEGRDTLIVIASDNGPESGARYYRDGATSPGSTGGLRGRKWSLYEGGIRSPLILRWPAGIEPGRVEKTQIAGAVDMLPTVATLAGAAFEKGDGIDLSPLLEGRESINRPPLFLATGPGVSTAEFPQPFVPRDRSSPFAVIDGRYKLLKTADGSKVELFDLLADPGETMNLASEKPNVVTQLETELEAWRSGLPYGRE